MTPFRSLSEALASPDKATELCLDCSELSEISEAIGELKGLEILHLINVHDELKIPAQITQLSGLKTLAVAGPRDCSVAFPTALFDVEFETFELANFRVREVFFISDRLLYFALRSHYIFDDFAPLCRNLHSLKSLTISGYGSLNQAGNKKYLQIPAEITALSELAELEFSHCALESLPSELIEVESLRRLSLSGTLNSDAKMFAERDDFEPLPPVLAELSQLETLVIDNCGVPSFEPLAGLSSLRSLSAEWAAANDLSPLKNLPLQELLLEHAPIFDLGPLRRMHTLRRLDITSSYVKDLSPLKELENLEELTISDATVDKRNPLTALEALIGLPKLEKVVAEHVTSEQWQQLRTSEPLDAARLEAALKSDDFEDVFEAINILIEYSIERSSHDHNALLDLFELESRWGETIEWPPLDEAMSRWCAKLDSQVLTRFIRATFVGVSDGWEATETAINELIRRRDINAELEVIDTFFDALEYYDPGHRYFEYTIHDRFCDVYFEDFEAQALVALLTRASQDMLDCDYGDQLGLLFVPAFHKLQEPMDAPGSGENGADCAYGKLLIDALRDFGQQASEGYGTSLVQVMEWIEEAAAGSYEELAQQLRKLAAELTAEAEAEADADDEPVDDSASKSVDADEAPEPVDDAGSKEIDRPVDISSLQSAFDADGVDALIAELNSLEKRGFAENISDYAAAFVNNKLIECLGAGQTQPATRLIHAYCDAFDHLGAPEGARRAALAGNAIVLLVQSAGDELETFLFETFIPNKIVDTRLAFNLACYWAVNGQRLQMLESIALAIELGKSREDFLNDADFEEFFDEADFLEVLDGKPIS